MSDERVYSEDEIKKYLSGKLPHWFYENGWIRRKYKTSGWKSTLMVVNTIGHLAEAAWHHPDLTISYATNKIYKTVKKLSKRDNGSFIDFGIYCPIEL